ncbi:hypothetical protein QU481_11315 [Crenobacter sp. SG2303]|uniref:Uncharacterized protein n=1 Tax=Crenobacter oryzisoli TaxID=3056844 RepID=A0ABT7XNV1_9NEIS|nr:hypothetical protein [Crenobacter sp. SG2303]MDN0075481.1 hypothetical protein [Crenobacter sp. SG2303]
MKHLESTARLNMFNEENGTDWMRSCEQYQERMERQRLQARQEAQQSRMRHRMW